MNDDKILELHEKDKIIGIIYKMTNTITNKNYVGQTRSHIKNRNKYRPFGYSKRFKDHISEAINNTKNNQSLYLNNSIRKYGKDVFTVELIEKCSVDDLDDREIYYILNMNTMSPNGYNLIEGNHCFSNKKVKNNATLQPPKKRGREYGYKHEEKTIEKMKKYHENINDETMVKMKEIMSNSITKHFIDKRVKMLVDSDIDIDENFKDLIRPHKQNNEIVSYVIRYKRRKYCHIINKNTTLEEKYKLLHDALKEAYEIRKNNKLTK